MSQSSHPTVDRAALSHDPAEAVEQASAFLAGQSLDSALVRHLTTGLQRGGASWLVEELHHRMLSRGEVAGRPATLSRRSFERDTGAYRTPTAIAAWMVRCQPRPALDQLFIDPACGAGQLLVAAAEFVLDSAPGAQDRVALLNRHLRGVELDLLLAAAARVCLRATLWPLPTDEHALDDAVRCGDGLTWLQAEQPPPDLVAHIVSNPPFQGVVERGFDAAALHAAPGLRVGGTANLAAVFWDRIDRFVAGRGYATILMPRNLLVSEATTSLRAASATAVSSVWLPGSARLFVGADVFVCVLHLDYSEASTAHCTVWTDSLHEVSARPPTQQEQGVRLPALAGADWWPAMCGLGMPEDAPMPSWIEIRAGMTTGDAYRVREFISEAGEGAANPAPRLLTTGLVDPGVALWGTVPCRFLKGVWSHPIIEAPNEPPLWLARMLGRARRPKIVVAGLCAGWEMFCDEAGEYAPSVGTWAIYDAADDVGRLGELYAALHAAPMGEWMHARLGANAMSGGSMTITRVFLEQVIPLALAHALSKA